jgi:hypothetical protein
LLVLALFSGKRAILVVFLVYPFFSVLVRRENKVPAVFYALLLTMGLSSAIMGNRQFFELPLGMQRALSVFPGDWNPEADASDGGIGSDAFRTMMRDLAWEEARKNPVFGRGLGIHLDTVRGEDFSDYNAVVLLAAGGAWHSTWFGLMADMGLPSVFLWALYVIVSLTIAYKTCHMCPPGSWRRILAGAIFLILCAHTLRSYTTGDASYGAINQWWLFAIIVAISYSLKAEKAAEPILPVKEPSLFPSPPRELITTKR